MQQKTVVGIDVGTHQIKIVVATHDKHAQHVRVLGTGCAQSRGIRHGYILNKDELGRALRHAVALAEKSAGTIIKQAFLSVGGVGLEEFRSRAELIVSRADGEITDLDVRRVLEESERKIHNRLINRKVIHTIPIAFRLDGERVLGRPVGLKGVKLEADTLFITTLEQHLNDLISVVEEAGISVPDVMASPLAGSLVTLTKAQKIAGVVLANIGAETVSIVVYENDIPVSVRVFPVGSTDITHDIALGLQLSLDDAESAKREGTLDDETVKNHLETIIAGRITDMFSLVEAHLKKIGKSGLLPAGIVLSGGGSGVATMGDIARATLKLPSHRATLLSSDTKIKDSTWAVAYGLCIFGANNKNDASISVLRDAFHSTVAKIKQFLP
jgi:cell division protein FtsA